MALLGIDFNRSDDYAATYTAALADGCGFVGRYLRDIDAGGFCDTREEAGLRAELGVKSFHVSQNDGHSEEVWEGRPDLGTAPGFATGAAMAEIHRDLQRAIIGEGGNVIVRAYDKVTTNDGRWPIAVALKDARGWQSVIGRSRLWCYGTGFTCRQMFAAGLVSGCWMSWPLEGKYDGKPTTKLSDVPFVNLLQYGNADRDPALDHYGVDGYCCHDRTTPGLPDPFWNPV